MTIITACSPEIMPSPLTDTDIIAFLKDNPDFLTRNPAACELLAPPATASGKGIADFQNFMIKRLKADKAHVVQSTRELVENARSNMNNQQRIQHAILSLLEATTFDDFIRAVTLDLAAHLDVDIAVFVVEAAGQTIPLIQQNGVRIIPEGTIDRWMADKYVILQDNISGIEAIYGGGATLVCSQVLLRIDIDSTSPPALIAFGSRNPDLFHDGQATNQIQFLARVIERCFRRWLNTPV